MIRHLWRTNKWMEFISKIGEGIRENDREGKGKDKVRETLNVFNIILYKYS